MGADLRRSAPVLARPILAPPTRLQAFAPTRLPPARLLVEALPLVALLVVPRPEIAGLGVLAATVACFVLLALGLEALPAGRAPRLGAALLGAVALLALPLGGVALALVLALVAIAGVLLERREGVPAGLAATLLVAALALRVEAGLLALEAARPLAFVLAAACSAAFPLLAAPAAAAAGPLAPGRRLPGLAALVSATGALGGLLLWATARAGGLPDVAVLALMAWLAAGGLLWLWRPWPGGRVPAWLWGLWGLGLALGVRALAVG